MDAATHGAGRLGRPYRIIIEGGGCLHNKGAEAMLLTAQRFLEQAVPGLRGYAIAEDPHTTARMRRLGLGVVVAPPCSQIYKGFALLKSQAHRRRARVPVEEPPVPTRFPYQYADAIVDVGGFVSSDQHGPIESLGRLRDRSGPWAMGRPILFLSQTWGPFRRRSVRLLTKAQLAQASLAVARDEVSLRHLRELGVPGRCRVEFAHDVAFHFHADPPQVGDALLAGAGCAPGGGPVVGVVPNEQVYRRSGRGGAANPYIRLLVDVVRRLLAQDLRVVVFAHRLIPGRPDRDDRFQCRLVLDGVGAHPNLFFLPDDYDAAQLKSVVGRLDLLVGSRFHSIIAAMSQRVPVVGVGWAHKYDELFAAVDLRDRQVGFRHAREGEVVERVLRSWRERAALREALAAHVPALEASSRASLERAAGILREHMQGLR